MTICFASCKQYSCVEQTLHIPSIEPGRVTTRCRNQGQVHSKPIERWIGSRSTFTFLRIVVPTMERQAADSAEWQTMSLHGYFHWMVLLSYLMEVRKVIKIRKEVNLV